MASVRKRLFKNSRYFRLNACLSIMGNDMRKWVVCDCMRKLRVGSGAVSVWRYAGADGFDAHYGGLFTCGSVWICPVCSVKIQARRQQELELVLGSSPSTKVMITYTIQHRLSDSLAGLLEDVKEALRYCRSGKRYQLLKKRYLIEGHVRAMEIRWSHRTGWHPHAHEVLLVGVPADQIDLALLRDDLSSAYMQKLQSMGYDIVSGVTVDVKVLHDVDSNSASDQASAYITKQALSPSAELSFGDIKKSRSVSLSPFQLLDVVAETGEVLYAELFREYAYATFRKNALTYSHGLKAKYGVTEKSDEQLANEVIEDAVLVCTIDYDNWQRVLFLDIRAEILEVAADHPDELIGWLAGRGIVAQSPSYTGDGVAVVSVCGECVYV